MRHPRAVDRRGGVDRPSEDSDGEKPVPPQAAEAPQQWPRLQDVPPPLWLPEGWRTVVRTQESGKKHKYYVDPVSDRRFWSKTEVNYFLTHGERYKSKRQLGATQNCQQELLQTLGRALGRATQIYEEQVQTLRRATQIYQEQVQTISRATQVYQAELQTLGWLLRDNGEGKTGSDSGEDE